MKQSRWWRRLVVLLVIGGVCGGVCLSQTAFAAPAQEAQKPAIELQGVEFKNLDVASRTAEILFTVLIKNPGMALRVQDLQYQLKLNDYAIAAGKYEQDVVVAAASAEKPGETIVVLPMTFDLTKVPSVAWNAITDSLTLRYELETEFAIPLFASLKHTQKTTFKGDFPLAAAASTLPAKLKEKLFGKP